MRRGKYIEAPVIADNTIGGTLPIAGRRLRSKRNHAAGEGGELGMHIPFNKLAFVI